MTTIRKIVTSKIDGSGADSNDTNEIRPFGEIAVYVNTEANPDKLTLMMFDGTRTNIKSMVLAPGRLYGSDADSGDGNGRDTIKLIPDASLSDYTGNDQYLIIDPTGGEPGHIHLRAGGIQDQSTADLYLGAEQTFVRISDTNDNVVIRTSVLGEGIFPYSWTFDNDGKLTLPGTIEYANGTLATGGGLVTPPDSDYIIGTQQLQTVSAECAPRGSGDNFVADTTDNDDITVVREGWNVVVDGTTYTVTTIMNGIDEFDIFATGANFVQGTTYTFTNPIPLAHDWSFGLDGVLSTPALGTISHINNDLKVEVTGTDVIVLRTAGGDLLLNSNGSLETPGILILPNDNRITTGGDLNSNSINFSLPDPITGSQRFDFAFDASYGFPVLRFPDDSLQTTAWTGGRVRDVVPAHSYGATGDKEGDLAFNNGYIYYCTQDYVSNSINITTLASTGSYAYVSSAGYTGDLVSDFTANSTGWTYNGVTIVSVVADNGFGPGYLLEGTASFGTVNETAYALVSPSTPNIWKRVAWSADTW